MKLSKIKGLQAQPAETSIDFPSCNCSLEAAGLPLFASCFKDASFRFAQCDARGQCLLLSVRYCSSGGSIFRSFSCPMQNHLQLFYIVFLRYLSMSLSVNWYDARSRSLGMLPVSLQLAEAEYFPSQINFHFPLTNFSYINF